MCSLHSSLGGGEEQSHFISKKNTLCFQSFEHQAAIMIIPDKKCTFSSLQYLKGHLVFFFLHCQSELVLSAPSEDKTTKLCAAFVTQNCSLGGQGVSSVPHILKIMFLPRTRVPTQNMCTFRLPVVSLKCCPHPKNCKDNCKCFV